MVKKKIEEAVSGKGSGGREKEIRNESGGKRIQFKMGDVVKDKRHAKHHVAFIIQLDTEAGLLLAG